MNADHCQGCPFMSCHDCAFQGGVDPNAPVAQRDSGATRRANQGVLWENYLDAAETKAAPGRSGTPTEGLTTRLRLQGMSKEEPRG